jgi:hypothetical protein
MTERHFRVVQLEGKKVEIGGVSISSKASPGNAARKLLTSIAHHKGLKKNKKPSMGKVKFCIQEYTQGSSKKVYGPYVGHFHKYTGEELKKAMTADGKVKFTMKPVVKLAKGSMKNKSGGIWPWNSEPEPEPEPGTTNNIDNNDINDKIWEFVSIDGNMIILKNINGTKRIKEYKTNIDGIDMSNSNNILKNHLYIYTRIIKNMMFKAVDKPPNLQQMKSSNKMKSEYYTQQIKSRYKKQYRP